MDVLKRFASGLDAIVGAVSPATLARRQLVRNHHRRMMQASSAWDGASSSRRWADRVTTTGSADADLDRDDIDRLRSRSRDRWRNDGLAHGAVNAMVENIASGLRPMLRLDHDALGITRDEARRLQRQAAQIWREWSRTADSCERVTMDELQPLVLATVFLAGDCLVRPVMVSDSLMPSRFELRLQVTEGDHLDTPHDKLASQIRNGVEIGERGEPVAYWISAEHPGDSLGRRTFHRVPRFAPTGRPNVLHVYVVERPGQSRGRPLLSPVLDAFKDLDDYVEAEVIRAQVAACFAAFITRNDPLGGMLASTAPGTPSGQPRETEIIPGGIHQLSTGESVSFGNPSSPNSAFEQFMRATRRLIVAPLGLPYEIATSNFTGMNYSNARAAFLVAWRAFARRQRWMVNCFLQPVWEMLLEEAWLKGIFEARDFAARRALWTNSLWTASGKGWIDPLKEAQAEKLKLEMGLTTRAQIVAAADGTDWETDVAPQLIEEEQLLAELRQKAGVSAPAPQSEPDAPPEETDPDSETEPQEQEQEAFA